MRHESAFPKIDVSQFANLGAGHIAYMRELGREEALRLFPGVVLGDDLLQVWGLFAADGKPLVIADNAGAAISAAIENQLMPVTVH